MGLGYLWGCLCYIYLVVHVLDCSNGTFSCCRCDFEWSQRSRSSWQTQVSPLGVVALYGLALVWEYSTEYLLIIYVPDSNATAISSTFLDHTRMRRTSIGRCRQFILFKLVNCMLPLKRFMLFWYFKQDVQARWIEDLLTRLRPALTSIRYFTCFFFHAIKCQHWGTSCSWCLWGMQSHVVSA